MQLAILQRHRIACSFREVAQSRTGQHRQAVNRAECQPFALVQGVRHLHCTGEHRFHRPSPRECFQRRVSLRRSHILQFFRIPHHVRHHAFRRAAVVNVQAGFRQQCRQVLLGGLRIHHALHDFRQIVDVVRQPVFAVRRLAPSSLAAVIAERAVLSKRQANRLVLRIQRVPVAQRRVRRFFRQRHANQHQQRQQNACQPLHSFSPLPKYRMSRRQNVSFCGSSAVFYTFLTTMREPSICVTRIFVPFSMKSPSLTTFNRTPSNSPSPVGLSAVVAVPSRPRNTCMSSAER